MAEIIYVGKTTLGKKWKLLIFSSLCFVIWLTQANPHGPDSSDLYTKRGNLLKEANYCHTLNLEEIRRRLLPFSFNLFFGIA